MAMEDFDAGMPSLEEMMKGTEPMPRQQNNGKDDDDLGFDVDDRPFDPFAPENQNDRARLENDPNQQQTRKDEVVFDVIEDDDNGEGDDDEFKDTRKRGDPRKMSRLQREMRQKAEARDKLSALNKQIDRIAADTTEAIRGEMKSRQNLASTVKNQALSDIQRFQTDLQQAQEAGDTAMIGRIARAQAESEAIILKADALLSRYTDEAIAKYVYDPKIPDDLRNPNAGGTPKGRDWVDANAHWFNNPDKYGAEIAFAQATDKQLAKEGKFDVNSDAYYEELTRRVALKMRDIDVYTPDGRVARVGERQRGGSQRHDTTGSSTPAGANQQRRPSNGNQQRDVITPEEQRMMRMMGLDLNNPEHLKELKANRVK